MAEPGLIFGSNLSRHLDYKKTMKSMRDNVARNEQQITSGKKTDKFVDLGKDGILEYVMLSEASLSRIDTQVKNNKSVLDRMAATELKVSEIINVARDFKKDFTIRNSASGRSSNISQIAKNYLASIQNSLNAQHTGRYLFSGSRTKDMPVTDIVNNTNIIGDEVSANYYLGDNIKPEAQVTESITLEYGLTANEEAFANLIGALHFTIEADEPNDKVLFENAEEALTIAIEKLVDLQTTLGNNRKTIEDVNDQFERTKNSTKDYLNGLVNTDVVEATTELHTNRVVLEASFRAFAQTQDLNLMNYVK